MNPAEQLIASANVLLAALLYVLVGMAVGRWIAARLPKGGEWLALVSAIAWPVALSSTAAAFLSFAAYLVLRRIFLGKK